MVVGAKVCELTDGFLWFVCGLYVGILTSPLNTQHVVVIRVRKFLTKFVVEIYY